MSTWQVRRSLLPPVPGYQWAAYCLILNFVSSLHRLSVEFSRCCLDSRATAEKGFSSSLLNRLAGWRP